MFESEFGTKMIRADEKVRAIAADAVTAQLMGVAPGSPLLSVERLTYTYGERPVEVRKGLYTSPAIFYYRNAKTS